MRNTPALLILSISVLLNACATPARETVTPAPEVASEPASSPVIHSEGILEYTGKILAMPAAGQREELARLDARLAVNNQDLSDRTKTAAIHALSEVPDIRNTARAQVLLDELSRESDPDIERTTLVRILRNFIVEQQKIIRENNRLNQKIVDEQRQVEALQQKLEELKKIERNIVDRKVMDK
jgi:hypothetical protein